MAYDGWLNYDGTVLVDVHRTVLLAQSMGVDTVRVRPNSVAWLSASGEITDAPWYDPQYPASSEFAGIIPLSLTGLDDSSLESTATEYITDGGHGGKPRNATQPLVANFALIAKTERGAEYGKRWMDRVLRGVGQRPMCVGADLRYYRWAAAGAPVAHRRNVRLSRGSSVTRKRKSACAVTWLVTLTLTAADPYEYGEEEPRITSLGGAVATGPGVTSFGTLLALTETPCPQYDYSPIYDPLHPALVAPPEPPDFLPAGWGITAGEPFDRRWARISPTEPSSLNVVPVIKLTTTTEARMVRVSVWPASSTPDDQCDPLFSAVVSYLPANVDFFIDGETGASYTYDGTTARRTDSLVYSPDANPLQWAAFNDDDGLLVTLDVFDGSGGGNVRAALSLVPKSD